MQIPAAVVEGLGSSKRPLVKVTINGHTYRSAIAVMGGAFMLGVSAENRAAAGVEAGQEVDVDLELDTEPREVAVPVDFAKALDGDAEARRFFDGLSYSKKLVLVRTIDVKNPEVRQRRIDSTVGKLREGRT